MELRNKNKLNSKEFYLEGLDINFLPSTIIQDSLNLNGPESKYLKNLHIKNLQLFRNRFEDIFQEKVNTAMYQ